MEKTRLNGPIAYGLITVIISCLLVSPTFQSAYSLIPNVSDYFDQRPELYKIGSGIMKLDENHTPEACIASEIKSTDGDIDKNPEINPDNLLGRLFVVINKSDSDSYRLLETMLPADKGFSSYRNYLYDQDGNFVTGHGFGTDSTSGIFRFETFANDETIDEEKLLLDHMEGKSKFEGYGHPLKPGKYHFESLLYKHTGLSTENMPCVFVLEWKFTVHEDGTFSTEIPKIREGTIVNVTDQFSLKIQKNLGLESWSVVCKEGQSVLSQKKHFFYEDRFACVSQDTKSKLIQRGWTLSAPVRDLTYFEKSEEMEIGKKFEAFMKKKPYNNVPDAFVIGKYNFKNNGDFVYFCGKFKDVVVNYGHYFNGAIDNFGNIVWDGAEKQSEWCAISDNAHKFSFVYDWVLEK